jgi:hypothetical protein
LPTVTFHYRPSPPHARALPGRQAPAFLVSLILHVAGVFLLQYAGPPGAGPRRASERLAWPASARRAKLVWYSFRERPPELAPARSKRPAPIRARKKADLTLVASARKPTRGQQITWREDHREAARPRKVANLVAFEPPKPKPTATRPAALLAPPEVAPSTASTLAAGLPQLRGVLPSAPLRTFQMPARQPAAPARTSMLEPPPEVAGQAEPHISAVAIDLRPGGVAALPEGMRAANIAVAPQPRPGPPSGGSGPGLSVPGMDLTLRGAGAPAGAPAAAANQYVSRTLYATGEQIAARRAIRSLPQPAAKVPPAVREFSQSRDVYLVLLPPPNPTHYTGDWLLWFGERAPLPGADPRMQPPVPFRVVDPVSEQSVIRIALKGRVRVKAIVRKTGFVDEVQILEGIDERIDIAIGNALRRWTFQPALRSGIMVDIDVLLEIPFAARAASAGQAGAGQ